MFGLIAALAALVLALQAIRRKIPQRPWCARICGRWCQPVRHHSDASIGIICAVAVGALLAVAVAVAASPLALLGQLHRLEPIPACRSTGPSSAWARRSSLLAPSAATAVPAHAEVSARPSGGRGCPRSARRQ
jgi:hypothetical protein